MRTIAKLLALLVLLQFAVAIGSAGDAYAKTNVRKQARSSTLTMDGVTTCSATATLRVGPLSYNPTASSTAVSLVVSTLKGCTDTTQSGQHVKNGHLVGLAGELPSGATCVSFLSGSAVAALSAGSVVWAPHTKIAPSSTVSFPRGTLSVTSGNLLKVSYSGGTVTGSYATTSAGLTATSSDNTNALVAQCSSGLATIGFRGSVTL